MEKQKIISYASKSDYLARKPIKEAIGNPLLKGTDLVGQNTSSPIDNVELSSRTKGLNSSEVKEKIEDKVRDIPEKLKAKLKEGQSAGGHLLNQAGTALFKGVKSFLIPSSKPFNAPAVPIPLPLIYASTLEPTGPSKALAKFPKVLPAPVVENPFKPPDIKALAIKSFVEGLPMLASFIAVSA